MRRWVVLVVLVAVVVACGDETTKPSGTDAGKKYVDAILTSYRASGAKNAITAGEARCLAESAIDAVGTNALRAASLQPSALRTGSSFQTLGSKLSKPNVDQISRAMVKARCVPIGAMLLRAGAGDAQVFSRVSKAKVRCIFQRLGAPDAAQRALADSLLGLPRGDAESTAAFRAKAVVLRALSSCKVDPSLLQ